MERWSSSRQWLRVPAPPPIMRSLHLYHMSERGGEHSMNPLAAASDGMSAHLGQIMRGVHYPTTLFTKFLSTIGSFGL